MSTQAVLNGNGVHQGPEGPIAPNIGTGGFFWRPTDIKVMQLADGASTTKFAAKAAPTVAAVKISAPQIVGEQKPRFTTLPGEPPLLTKDDGNVLSLLQKRTFIGKGFNMIFRPRSNKPLKGDEVPGTDDNVLQLNLTQETQTFSESLGNIPNRGFAQQEDIMLKGISYVQKVDDITNPATGKADGPPSGIHFEPGVWLAVPKCTVSPPNQAPTLARMASIPHGTTINAQGAQPDMNRSQSGTKLAASIPKVDITPFFINNVSSKVPFGSQTFSNSKDNRIPGDLTKFANKQVKIREILADPNEFLRNTLEDQAAQGLQVVEFIKADINTLQTPTLGGGTANIAFLGGTSTSPMQGGSDQNAHAVSMTFSLWIETVRSDLSIRGNQSKEQRFQPAGAFGPTFIVGPTTGLKDDFKIPVTWTQLQYSQNVLLNFAPLSWPHVSVATLAENTTFDVSLRALA